MKILIADDSKTNLAILSSSLIDLGHEVIQATSGQDAIDKFESNHPDLIILDVVMDNMDGFECARRIRQIESNQWIPIIFLSSSVDDESISKGIDAGGDDYLTKPYSEITLAAKIKAMQRIADMRKQLVLLTEELSILSATDPLTGLYNRLQFNRSLKEKIAQANRHGFSVALMFLDLDKFKIINDTLGHQMGDLLLKEVAVRLKHTLRLNDFIYRLGGDEFAIIIEVTDCEDAAEVAQKVVANLGEEYVINDHHLHVSCSLGIACYPSKVTGLDDLIKHADIAMYRVKETTRNGYMFYEDLVTSKV